MATAATRATGAGSGAVPRAEPAGLRIRISIVTNCKAIVKERGRSVAMHMNITMYRTMLAIGLTAAIGLAACGSSSPKASVTPGAQPGASTTTPGGSAPAVMMSNTASLGSILVDGTGMTVYTLTNGGKAVPCAGQCATFWPPLLLAPGTVTAMGASGVTGLGTATVSGGLQVTSNGLPLYRFSMDKAPGDTKGEGITSFGGTWHVAKASATTSAPAPPVVTSPPTTGAPAATTTNPYGY
jgi:predicted lipoprotein with Yx(FWY)xxD motif